MNNKYFFIFIVQLFNISFGSLFSQEQVSLLDNRITFNVPEGTVKTLFYHDFASDKEYKNYYKNNIISFFYFFVSIDGIQDNIFDLKDLSNNLIELLNSRNYSQHELLTLLRQHNNVSAFFMNDPSMINNNYALIEYNSEIIGELYAADGSIDIVSPLSYGYSINLVVGDYIVCIRIRMHDEENTIPSKIPEYFYYDVMYQKFCWRDFDISRKKLYQKLCEGDYHDLPTEFQKLRETLDMILNTLIIKDFENPEITENAIRKIINATISLDSASSNNLNEDLFNSNASEIILNDTEYYLNSKIEKKWLLFLFIPFVSLAMFFLLKDINNVYEDMQY